MSEIYGDPARPYLEHSGIEYILDYHKGRSKPKTPVAVSITIAVLASTFSSSPPYPSYVSGTFHVRVTEPGPGSSETYDINLVWSARNTNQFLNFSGCLYYQGAGSLQALIFPIYNYSWQFRYISATVNGAPLIAPPTIGVPYPHPVGSYDAATGDFAIAAGSKFSASATCDNGQVMIGQVVLNPAWVPPQPRIAGYGGENEGYIFSAVPRYFFIPLSQGLGSASLNALPSDILAGADPYLGTVVSNGDGTTSLYDPSIYYPPFQDPPA